MVTAEIITAVVAITASRRPGGALMRAFRSRRLDERSPKANFLTTLHVGGGWTKPLGAAFYFGGVT